MPCCFTTPDYNHADALRAVTESPEVTVKYYNEAFVLMQYFGYLRRDPDISTSNGFRRCAPIVEKE